MDLLNEIKIALFSANPDVKCNIKKCYKVHIILKKLLSEVTNIGEKQKLIAAIGQVKSYSAMFNALRITGEGYSSRKLTARDNVKWSDLPSAFQGRMKTGLITNLRHIDAKLFLEDASAIFCKKVIKQLKEMEFIKINAVFCAEFMKQSSNDVIKEIKYINTINHAMESNTNRKEWFTKNIQTTILSKLEEFQERDSGWALSRIINLQININKFTPLLGSSYIPLPREIKRKEACINVKNQDDRCFVWAVVSALYPVRKHAQRPSKYPNPMDVLNLTGIHFPMTAMQIPRFEKQNNVSINVYKLQKNKNVFKTLPTYLTKNKQSKHVNLLIIQDFYYDDEVDDENGDDSMPQYHYVWIKNLSRLLSKQLDNHNGEKYFCDRCLHYFKTTTKLNTHYENCLKMGDCKMLPPSGNTNFIKFKNFRNKLKAAFIIYADLECLLIPCEDGQKYQKHKPCSVAYYVKCSYDPTLSFYRSYRGSDCMRWFVKELNEFAENVETVFLCDLPMNTLTIDEKYTFNNAKLCYICEKTFVEGDKRVRDHCHLTGKFRGAAHEECNINFKDTYTVPVVFHNLSGYDSHFIIKNLALDMVGKIDLLPINKERYISFTKQPKDNLIKFRFIDSYRFMASGLDKLASYLSEYPELKNEFKNLDETKLALLTRKGVYPYDYFNEWAKFQENKLPDKSYFYNKLNDCYISDDDYKHAQEVWKQFNCQNLGEYSDLYLKTDVLLLSDVFEQFRKSCLQTYNLDPAQYYTLPGYTWDAMLKHTDITLELLTDIDMIYFIQNGIRGGLSQCSLRYAKANNTYYQRGYDPTQPMTFLLYNDINNQYGWAMSQPLPYGGFKWIDDNIIEKYNQTIGETTTWITNLNEESDTGYVFEVDIGYPYELHDKHQDLPFCPEHRSPPGVKRPREGVKLMATLFNKEKYVIHYSALKQVLSHGLKLEKIHRILEFKQNTWLKSYIDLNTQLRTVAKNEFEKNLFKLMNNAVFGKTMEDVRKHSVVKLITKWEGRYGAESYICRPEFKSSTIFDDNLVAIELKKTELYFNKPIYVGQAILDIAKTKIYEFHYDYMKPIFGDKCYAAYTDTDSIIYMIEHKDIYNIIKRDCHIRFDTSDYPKNNIYDIPLVNKKVLGLMKDEMNGRIMTEFVGLRAKMYSIRVEDEDVIKKAKGVKSYVIKNQIVFNDYIECLNNCTEKSVEQNLIRSNKHQVSSITQTKIALSPHDDKRYLLKNSYKTLPWGHYSIMDTD